MKTKTSQYKVVKHLPPLRDTWLCHQTPKFSTSKTIFRPQLHPEWKPLSVHLKFVEWGSPSRLKQKILNMRECYIMLNIYLAYLTSYTGAQICCFLVEKPLPLSTFLVGANSLQMWNLDTRNSTKYGTDKLEQVTTCRLSCLQVRCFCRFHGFSIS